MKTSVEIIFVTFDSEPEAVEVVRNLVEEGLVACASVIPKIRSIYHWNGRVEDQEEVMVMLKTRDSLSSSVITSLVDAHSYDNPEVLRIAVDGGSESYLDWIRGATQ